MKLTGTDTQVKYAKDLLNELVDERRISILEGRGIENLSDKHLEKYNYMVAVRDAVESVDANAGIVIGMVNDFNGGGHNMSELELIIKIKNI